MQSTRPSPQPSRPGVSCSITVATADAVKTHQEGVFPTTFDAAMRASVTLFWQGEPAREFAREHLADLTPGRPLQVDLHRLRVHVSGSYAEMQAEIAAVRLLPTRFEVAG